MHLFTCTDLLESKRSRGEYRFGAGITCCSRGTSSQRKTTRELKLLKIMTIPLLFTVVTSYIISSGWSSSSSFCRHLSTPLLRLRSVIKISSGMLNISRAEKNRLSRGCDRNPVLKLAEKGGHPPAYTTLCSSY